MSMKPAILLVAFGTSVPTGREALINIDKLARGRFAGTEIRWAYTSRFIRRKLARQGQHYDSPRMALTRLHEDGYTHVAVQSLHVAAGAEFHDLARTVRQVRRGPDALAAISLGKPLLSRYQDLQRVVAATLNALPEHEPGDAIILMGHGNDHGHGEMALAAAAATFSLANPMAMLATVEGEPAFATVLKKCRQQQPRRALLLPFMTVAGDHAANDLAGDDADSWKCQLRAIGIDCTPVLRGLGENNNVVNVWMDHLQAALTELQAGASA